MAAHHRLALEGGLSPDIAAAVADGRRPERMADDEKALYDFCTALHRDGRVSDATYASALAEFGEQGIVDMVGRDPIGACRTNGPSQSCPPARTSQRRNPRRRQ